MQNIRQEIRFEMAQAMQCFHQKDDAQAIVHLERAHILGQRFFWTHLITHWWMFKIAVRHADGKEIFGQITRMIATVPGYILGWVPVGNTGGANVSPVKPMPIPSDLKPFFKGYSVWRGVGWRVLLANMPLVALAGWQYRHAQKAAEVEKAWNAQKVSQLAAFGSTREVRIMPLVNWHAASPKFKTEAGVSYWVKTDQHTVLFDVVWNANNENPSPIQHNMQQLGLSMDAIDTVFISHSHHDHVGGSYWERSGSFSLGNEQIALKAQRAFAPIAMTYPGLNVEAVLEPRALRKAIASTGPIERQLVMGRFGEQAMVVNIEGKGLLVVVGCGHQTVSKLLERIKQSFNLPIYALVGDLHYPIPEGRRNAMGVNLQKLFASGQGVTQQLTMEEVRSDLQKIKETVQGLVAIGGHDTSDEVIELFAKELGSKFRRVEVGSEIKLN